MIAFDWRIVAGALLLYFLFLRKPAASAAGDECGCEEYGSAENFAKGGLR